MQDDIFPSIFSECKPIEGYFEVFFYFKEKENNIVKKRVFVDDFIPYKKIPKDYEELCDKQKFMPIFSTYKELNNFLVG